MVPSRPQKLTARVVHASVKGYGSALRKGIEEARGRFIIMGDADGSAKWREGYSFVVGRGTLTAFGFIGDAVIFADWASRGFGQLHAVRTVFFCSLAFFLGVEIVFSSVFLSMLGISRATYIGE
jgi:hypothetical protein